MQKDWSNQPMAIRHFVLVCVAFELLALAGMGFGFGDDIRRLMLALGGFWPDLLRGAMPIYPGQPIAMFATSAFLHGGLLHLFMNMVGLMWIGPIVTERLGERAFWPLAGLCALGSGFGFVMLSQSSMPMVGASGVLFGFLGIVAAWSFLDRLRRRESLRPLIEQALVFAALNIALALLSGVIAWQAHLGGLLAGMLCGLLTWNARAPLRRV
ncbi:rhomboid family intramembrane serine protease [Cognatishimia sp. F0-27]|uniref:rhomboid family intramembrane serine protease n=1 Tax=Cognatishimia sp. F0-27 TaxID=2816855 RepID=UPI001D0C7112|nr:rhomboid family intramembrane serine protease [Cognatishimia sp. F0-27]MCC1493744.1 rhomboid family intramembrane serine protease [Cognatishimia sp. F0-27]